jgi:hypothetical protein
LRKRLDSVGRKRCLSVSLMLLSWFWSEVADNRVTASAYTEMNATAKGASLGIYDKNKEKGMEPGRGTAQPHVELMGRRM